MLRTRPSMGLALAVGARFGPTLPGATLTLEGVTHETFRDLLSGA
jgi:hypothetical protein